MRRGTLNTKFYEYRNGILLSLFLESPSLRVADVLRRLEFVYGKDNVRKATVLEHLLRLYNSCVIDRKRFVIHPKRKRQNGNVFYKKRILGLFPVSAAIIAKTDKRKQAYNNFSEGKYEIYCRINPKLSPEYILYLKHEVARFFGFKQWYGGIIKENNNPLKTYTRIKRSYHSLKKARQRNRPGRGISYYLNHVSSIPSAG
jgi:hypothetical protein